MKSTTQQDENAVAAVRKEAEPLQGSADEERIVEFVAGSPLVLLGESSHGTHDFYALRARITQRLIESHGFSAVAIEGDWPDAYEVNRFVSGEGTADNASAALEGFKRFPTWMWRNTAVASFVSWLREHNARRSGTGPVGFYGLDLYSLHASMRAVIEYLQGRDPAAARAARASYACFEDFNGDTEHYAWATGRLGDESCEEAVARELVALQRRAAEVLRRDAGEETDEYFHAVQNARVAHNAERYYRSMARGRVESWNMRDRHMAETLDELLDHLRRRRQPERIVVWAHNSHLGDARATDATEEGELNLGQLVRERYPAAARSIGFTTFQGTVLAAKDWGEPGLLRRVRPALERSYERLFHDTGIARFFLPLNELSKARLLLAVPRLERAIGVIYRPDTERWSHYFNARLSDQFDGVIHLDDTRAVDPLETEAAWDPSEAPETFPSGV